MQQTFQSPDISCGHCKKAIEDALEPLGGVTRAEVDVERRSITVDFAPERIAETDIVRAVEAAGYPVTS